MGHILTKKAEYHEGYASCEAEMDIILCPYTDKEKRPQWLTGWIERMTAGGLPYHDERFSDALPILADDGIDAWTIAEWYEADGTDLDTAMTDRGYTWDADVRGWIAPEDEEAQP